MSKLDFNLGNIDFTLMTLEELRERDTYVSERLSWNKASLYLCYKDYAIIFKQKTGYYIVVDKIVLEWLDEDKITFNRSSNKYWKANMTGKKLDGHDYNTIYIHQYVCLKQGLDFANKQIHHINMYREDNRLKNLIAVDFETHRRVHEIARVCERTYINFISILRSGYVFDRELYVTVLRKVDNTFYVLANYSNKSVSFVAKSLEELNYKINNLREVEDLNEYEYSCSIVRL